MPTQPFWVNLLDMGPHAYGDTVYVNHPDTRILIDGGYVALADDRPGFPSIPSQLGEIHRTDPPFRVDLLVVTHCHLDHVGCLPRLVENDVLRADWALVADPDLGFPRATAPDGLDDRGAGPLPDLVATALREEPHEHLSDADLVDYLQDARTLEDRYRKMLDDLEEAGTRVRRYGRDDLADLEAEFGPRGLTVLGPTHAHLKLCRDHLAHLLHDGLERAGGFGLPDTAPTTADRLRLYRQLVRGLTSDDPHLLSDRSGRGAALNDQSIVLLFESGGARALLPGDMQLADPEIPGLDAEMAALVETVSNQAPFDFVKVPHHSSFNGLDADLLQTLQAAVLGHTGGRGSGAHPSRRVLDLLKRNSGEIEWVRTDRNGRVGVRLGEEAVRFHLAQGHRNDFRLPVKADEPAPTASRTGTEAAPSHPGAGQISVTRGAGDVIEVRARVPPHARRVTLTVDLEPELAGSGGRSAAVQTEREAPLTLELAGGRELERLLFVSSPDLGVALGSPATADRILDHLRAAGHHVLDTLPSAAEAAPEAAAETRAFLDDLGDATGDGPDVHGVVLLGNYRVVPSIVLDVLDADLRARVQHLDPDRFIVWSDAPYGDVDGDGIPELPVSRVLNEPGSAELLVRSLSARRPDGQGCFGVRNVHRPFADDIFTLLPGGGDLLVSAPTDRHGLPPRAAGDSAEYLMLHGSAHDPSRFWGEAEDGSGEIEAFHVDNVPRRTDGVVFTGCCWGALTVDTPASRWQPNTPVRAHTRRNSIAVRYLAAGALGFVGCTGAHYSPGPPYDYFGAPFHQVFWTFHGENHPPAKALHETRRLYGASIPHIRGSAEYIAIELKILQQFTCLGLGW